MAHMTNDMQAIRMSTAFGIISAFDSVFLFLATLIFMLRMNVKLTRKKKKKEVAALYDKYLRAVAELDNYKKTSQQGKGGYYQVRQGRNH